MIALMAPDRLFHHTVSLAEERYAGEQKGEGTRWATPGLKGGLIKHECSDLDVDIDEEPVFCDMSQQTGLGSDKKIHTYRNISASGSQSEIWGTVGQLATELRCCVLQMIEILDKPERTNEWEGKAGGSTTSEQTTYQYGTLRLQACH